MRTTGKSHPNDEQARIARVAEVAWLYYLRGENQQVIADRVGISRTAVSRVISEAREKGIVTFNIQHPWQDRALEQELVERFDLEEAIVVVPTTNHVPAILVSIGMAASRWLGTAISSASRISVSWGLSLRAMIDATTPSQHPDLTVIQAIGATGTESNTSDGPLLAQNLAEKLGAQLQLLHAPLLVDNQSVRDALLRDKHISAVLESAKKADIAFVGVGLPAPDENNLVRTGYITKKQALDLISRGAVGDICARYFDTEGDLLDIELNRRVMGVSPADMGRVQRVVGVSGGAHKGPAVLGALRGKYLDVLVTDRTVAKYVLAQ
jgi:DNA-binding transcriptional regulator LsrR (DeoR family)